MKIQEIITFLESVAPLSLQETYDNAGLLTGNSNRECTGIITCLDATEAVVEEAIEKKCNCIVAHHPIIFGGLRRITGKNYVEQTIITAIKNDIAIYAIHTNLDNVLHGVNAAIADKLGLINRKILQPKNETLKKLFTFVPIEFAENVRSAIFNAGGGHISNYSECSFNMAGQGTFKPGEGSNPFTGKKGIRHTEDEIKMEMIYPAWLEQSIIKAMTDAHPYEEVAYDIIALDNQNQLVGSGLVGELPEPLTETGLLAMLKTTFELSVIRHTPLLGKPVKKIALCGGAGSFLIEAAAATGADFYITGDIKYHEFFDANSRLVVADIGHYESEQFTIDLLFDILSQKFPTFAVLKTGVKTNPVHYFL
ncbi:MAG TPA: Nif3-like dinuclear metal center hexameric protein [Ferruginibacter sp.]|mgnify:CR=1 FL=1|nr:Nif3-like dinuclear metal center hexameric protein [Chitinophagaceae bacterium]MBK7557219.1 Nif3-like dinuclear metal center hexameric protein [Chitinophagaceae bacterium]MBK9532616.1 Nif3-like dinuclear metal center hexameric protein [Chitinophagaceae bacterium]HQW91956.1 Nif3-like dinuclear metal center hexameric protein [Ferruginibacter sp.]